MENTEAQDREISWLFEEAKSQLDKIENNSKQHKKQVLKELAKSLETKIPLDSTCIEITNQFRGKISESFVRQSLDNKYKQSHRVENAKKQNKKQNPSKHSERVEKLASLSTLNQENRNDKIIVVEASGQSMIQENENTDNDSNKNSFEEKEITNEPHNIWTPPNLVSKTEPQPVLKKKDHLDECAGCQELQAKIIELSDALKKATQFVIADQPNSQDKSLENSNIIQFEYSMVFDKMQKYLAQLFPKIHSYGDVWLKGQIDKKTGKVISIDFGRLNQT